MRFHEVPWSSMRFYDVPVNQSVLTEANRGLISYTLIDSSRVKVVVVLIHAVPCNSHTKLAEAKEEGTVSCSSQLHLCGYLLLQAL
jgi:hypothetical protein